MEEKIVTILKRSEYAALVLRLYGRKPLLYTEY